MTQKKYDETFSTRIDIGLRKQIKRYCEERGLKIQTFVEEVVINFFEKEGRYDKKKKS